MQSDLNHLHCHKREAEAADCTRVMQETEKSHVWSHNHKNTPNTGNRVHSSSPTPEELLLQILLCLLTGEPEEQSLFLVGGRTPPSNECVLANKKTKLYFASSSFKFIAFKGFCIPLLWFCCSHLQYFTSLEDFLFFPDFLRILKIRGVDDGENEMIVYKSSAI